MDLDTKHQQISVLGWITASWRDASLAWNKSLYQDIEYVALDPKKMWLPSFVLGNSAHDVLYIEDWYKLFKVRLFSSGSLRWSPGGIFTADCEMDVRYYPFDTQICSFKFENWIYDGRKVNLTVTPRAEDHMLDYITGNNGQWKIVANKVIRRDMYYAPDSVFPEVYFAVKFERKILFYIINIVLVSIFLSVLVLFTFFLPLESGERVSMGVTLLLSFSVFILMINDEIPRTSNEIPVIIIYIILTIAISTLSIAETVLVLNLYHTGGDKKPPAWMTRFHFCAKTCSCKDHTESNKPEPHQKSVTGLVYALCSPMYTQSYNKQNDVLESPTSTEFHNGIANGIIKEQQKEQEMKRNGDHKQQWKDIAMALDKCCFWLFLVLYLSVTLSLLVVIPRLEEPKDFSDIS